MKLAIILLAATAGFAQTGEVTIIAPGGIGAAINQLIPGFEAKTGYKVKATIGSGLGTKRQVANGEPFDIPILQPPYPEVIASGNVIESSAKPLASVAVGLAVRKGATRPDIATPDSFRAALLAAKSVSYPDAGAGAAAGVSFEATLKQLGIEEQLARRVRKAQGGAGAMAMVARGEVELGFTFLSEMDDPGIDVVGALPAAVSTPTTLVGFISAHAKNPDAARALLEFLGGPEAKKAYAAHGMTPAR